MSTSPCECCGEVERTHAYDARGHRIVRCRGCGLLSVADPPAAADLGALYGEDFFQAGEKFGDEDAPGYGAERNARYRLRLIGRPPGRLLDVGCATGDFLAVAREEGWEVAGVEWSRFAAERARQRGLLVENASFLEAQPGERNFDVITFWDYIEHVPNPAEHLHRARSLLAPDGVLVLTTGDTASLVAKLFGRHWHLMIPPKHLFFFDRRNILALLDRTGFSVQWLRWPGKYVNVGFVSEKVSALFPSPPTRALAWLARRTRLGRVDVRLNLRDIMTVIAAPTRAASAKPSTASG